MKYLRFTRNDMIACRTGEDNPNWTSFVRKALKSNGFDTNKAKLIKRCPVMCEEIYAQEDS